MDAGVVVVRVQVIDLKAFTIELQVPTYLPARDLTQRIARDAGFEAYWPDGKRRLYWLRARGRLLADEEKLQDLGVVNGELVYLLPEPPAGSGVVEQPPEYPETHPYFGAGWGMLVGSLVMVIGWSVLWGVAIVQAQSLWTTIIPGLTLGFLCTSLARHGWGGRANRFRVLFVGLFLLVVINMFAFLTPFALRPEEWKHTLALAGVGLVFGMGGSLLGWLAWWGAVEPLPAVIAQKEEAPQAAVLVQCGICGQPVDPSVRTECVHRCGQFFHQGCYKAKTSVYRGDRSLCAVCGKKVA